MTKPPKKINIFNVKPNSKKKKYSKTKGDLQIVRKNGDIQTKSIISNYWEENSLYTGKTEIIRKDIIQNWNKGEFYQTLELKRCNSCNCNYYHKQTHIESQQHIKIRQIDGLLSDYTPTENNLQPCTSLENSYTTHNMLVIRDNTPSANDITIRFKNISTEPVILTDIIYSQQTRGNSVLYTPHDTPRGKHVVGTPRKPETIHPGKTSTFNVSLSVDGITNSSEHKIACIFKKHGVVHKSECKIILYKCFNNLKNKLIAHPRKEEDWKQPRSISKLNQEQTPYNDPQEQPQNLPLTEDFITTLTNAQILLETKSYTNKHVYGFKEKIKQTQNRSVNEMLQTIKSKTTKKNFGTKYMTILEAEKSHQKTATPYTYGTVKRTVNNQQNGKITIFIDTTMDQIQNLDIRQTDKVLLKPSNAVTLGGIVKETGLTHTEIELLDNVHIPTDTIIKISPTIKLESLDILTAHLQNNCSISLDYMFPQSCSSTYIDMPVPSFCYKNYTNVNENQEQATKNFLSLNPGDPPLIITGPPGTGKSSCIIEIALNDVYCNKNRVLITTQTNKGVNELYLKFIKIKENLGLKLNVKKMVVRSAPVYDTCHRYCRLYKGHHKYPSLPELQSADIVITTYVTSCRFIAILHNNKVHGIHFQTIIMDESAYPFEIEIFVPINTQCLLGQTLLKIVLVGDQKQLNHQARDILGREARHTCILSRLLETKLYTETKHLHITLTTNFRSSTKIVNFLSSEFYDNKITPHRDNPGKLIACHIDTFYETTKGSKFSIPEGEYAISLAKDYSELQSVTICCYYKSQKIYIEKRLSELSLNNIKVSTAEAVQGLESEVVITSLCLAKTPNPWHEDTRRLNVLISRAANTCIFIGDLLISTEVEPLRRLITNSEIYASTQTKELIALKLQHYR